MSRSRIYALAERGELDDVGDGQLRVSLASIERRLAAARPAGQPLSPSSAWAVLALASADAAFRAHVASRLSDPDRSRARARLVRHSLLELLPRVRGRSTARRFAVGAEPLLNLLADARLILAGPSAARALGWLLPADNWPLEAYLAETALVDIVEHYALEPDGAGDLVLRSVPEPWPFPPQARVVPELVAALDLADGPTPRLAELGRARLNELTATLDPSWQRRPPRRPRRIRPLIPSRAPAGGRLRAIADHQVWDDRAERDARGLVALLFVSGGPRRRAELAEALRISLAAWNTPARSCAPLRRMA